MRAPLALAILAALAAPVAHAADVDVDGILSPGEWDDAQHITDFRLTQPLSRAPAPQPTEAWVKATPQGLAIAFRNLQDPSVPRTRQRAQRDQGGAVDRVNLYVDFDGDGRTGYNFTLLLSDSIVDGTITNENQFNNDWDGDWRHAVHEDEAGWNAEMLIPWYIAPMRKADGGTRTIALSLDRVLGATGERASWPAVSFTEQKFLTRLEKIDIPKFSQALLAVTPYVVGVYDAVGKHNEFDAGGDVFWKPSGQFQLSGTLNPDFGQVESDQLVVNFGATETFFSDKRPFFTENQSFFDVPFGSLGNANRLIYTRRVGGATDLQDDGDAAGDVTAAVKLNGSVAGLNYGMFAASEADEVGRDFYAARVTRDFANQGVGFTFTQVRHPETRGRPNRYSDRDADVYAIDHRFSPNAQWNIRTTAVGSSIDQAGATTNDSGAQMRIDYDMGKGWRQQLYMLHLGDALMLNDFGYLERNNFNYARYELAHRVTSLPEGSPYNAHEYRWAVSRRVNDDGVHIADAWAVNRQSDRADGGNQFMEVAGWTSGHDDLILRGNGVVRVPSRLYLFAERFRPRKGHWSWYGNSRYAAEGLDGPRHGGLTAYFESNYFVSDSLSFGAGLEATHRPDWLLWRPADDGTALNRLGSFRSDMLAFNAGLTWLVDSKQELRVRLEAIGLDAKSRYAVRVGSDGVPVRSDEVLDNFALQNMGFQVRYRYELAPLSNLYIAYTRGGEMFDQSLNGDYQARSELGDAFSLRDSEQLLVKLSYRFEI